MFNPKGSWPDLIRYVSAISPGFSVLDEHIMLTLCFYFGHFVIGVIWALGAGF